jgi:hypothetical protein
MRDGPTYGIYVGYLNESSHSHMFFRYLLSPRKSPDENAKKSKHLSEKVPILTQS